MDTNTAILASMLIPALAALGNIVLRNSPNLRDGMTLTAAVLTFLCVLNILANVGSGTTEPLVLFSVMPGLDLAFNVEPLGLLFALIASGLWIVTHLYGVGYMRGNNESHHARFFCFFSIAIATTKDLGGMRRQMQANARMSAEERVLTLVRDLVADTPAGDWTRLPVTREQLGEVLGLTLETVSRMMQRLAHKGALEVAGSRVRLARTDERS